MNEGLVDPQQLPQDIEQARVQDEISRSQTKAHTQANNSDTLQQPYNPEGTPPPPYGPLETGASQEDLDVGRLVISHDDNNKNTLPATPDLSGGDAGGGEPPIVPPTWPPIDTLAPKDLLGGVDNHLPKVDKPPKLDDEDERIVSENSPIDDKDDRIISVNPPIDDGTNVNLNVDQPKVVSASPEVPESETGIIKPVNFESASQNSDSDGHVLETTNVSESESDQNSPRDNEKLAETMANAMKTTEELINRLPDSPQKEQMINDLREKGEKLAEEAQAEFIKNREAQKRQNELITQRLERALIIFASVKDSDTMDEQIGLFSVDITKNRQLTDEDRLDDESVFRIREQLLTTIGVDTRAVANLDTQQKWDDAPAAGSKRVRKYKSSLGDNFEIIEVRDYSGGSVNSIDIRFDKK